MAGGSAAFRLEAHYEPFKVLLTVDHITQALGFAPVNERPYKYPVLAFG